MLVRHGNLSEGGVSQDVGKEKMIEVDERAAGRLMKEKMLVYQSFNLKVNDGYQKWTVDLLWNICRLTTKK